MPTWTRPIRFQALSWKRHWRFTWRLARDPAVRAASFGEAPTVLGHVVWLWKWGRTGWWWSICRSAWVVWTEGLQRPVGLVRIGWSQDVKGAEIHVAISGWARGMGLGTAVLRALTGMVMEAGHVNRIVARMKPENEGSRTVFRRAGYVETDWDEEGTGRATQMEYLRK